MHLALGNGEFASFKVDDFAAYERQTRRLLAAALGGDPAAKVYPEPVEHCAICRSSGTRSWSPNGTAAAWSPTGGCSRCPNRPAGTCSSISRGPGTTCEDGREFGLQYLFGVVDTAEADEAGRGRYTQIRAFDRPGEKRAFEELTDFITERRARRPGLHVYHYNHYEPTSAGHLTELHGTRQEAVGALMGRFATREDEVDDLFRLGVFTDLYRVVRQGVRAGVENYSIKYEPGQHARKDPYPTWIISRC